MSDLDNEEIEATKKLQEKTADEMFEEFGYKKTRDGIDCWTIYENDKLRISFEIGFGQALFFQNKQLNDENDLDKIIYIDKKIIPAINKKCKELGWLDD